MTETQTIDQLQAENAALRRRLEEAEETLEAIRQGAVDAFLVEEPRGERVYTLQTADRPYRLLVECMQEGALTLTADGTILFCNGHFAELVKAAPERLPGRRLEEHLPPDVVPPWQALLVEARTAVCRRELVLRSGAGRQVPVHLTLSPLEIDGTAALCAVVTDLTERKYFEELQKTQEALRASEARFRLAMRAITGVVWEWDLRSGSVFRSEGLYDLIGVRPEEVPPTRDWWIERIHPDDRLRLWKGVEDLINTAGQFASDYRVRHEDGRWIDVWERGIIERDETGQAVRLAGFTADVSDRKHTEDALRASEERFRSMANTSPAIIWTADPTGAITFHNQRWLSYTGISPEENVHDWPVRVLHPEDRERCMRMWQQALEQGTEYEIEVRNRRHDGEYRWFLTRATPIRDDSGCIVEWYGSTTDIHDRKLAEEAAKEADRRKDEFLAMLAHELRNPLAPIRNAVQILRLLAPREPALSDARDMIERQVTHLVRLVDDLLDISRVSRGKIHLDRCPLDLAAVVRQAAETSQPLLEARRHRLVLSLPDEPVRVEGDFTRLAQVVANLLNNAAKYTDEGGTIWLAIDKTRQGGDGSGGARIRVRDTGRGIDPAAIDSLFDLFYQVDRNLDRADGGLGIGLSLVKSLVEMHGGRVEAHSPGRGQGSEFLVHLPCLPDDSPNRHAQMPEPPARQGSGVRILAVDDNHDSAESLAILLRIDGHEVLTAHDGRTAVELALREHPAVVLLDIGLPHLDGYQVCQMLRDSGLTDTLLVAITGYCQEEDRRRSQEAGFDAHLVKPVDLQALRQLLAERAVRQ